MPSRTRQGVGFFLGIGLCCTRDGGYDFLRALVSASCEITHKARGTICCGHWVLYLVVYYTRDTGTIYYGYWVLRLAISHTRQGVRFVTGIGICVS